jgi:hypothetical protein
VPDEARLPRADHPVSANSDAMVGAEDVI